jgi:hypothetical protein
MSPSRVLLSVLLSACSLLSLSCGAPGQQCQSTGITCANGTQDVQACCTANQCNYVVSAKDAGVAAQVFSCNGIDCQSAQNAVWNFCGPKCQLTGSCATTADTIKTCCTTRCDVIAGGGVADPDAGITGTPTVFPCNGTDCQAAQQSATSFCTPPTPTP